MQSDLEMIGPGKKKRCAVVITDFRRLPLAAAFSIQSLAESKADILISERHVKAREYGDKTDLRRRARAARGARFLVGAIIVPARSETDISHDSTGIDSSLYSLTKDSSANLESYPEIGECLHERDKGAREVLDAILELGYQEIYIFNGRLASSYGIVKGCEEAGIDLHYYEYSRLRRVKGRGLEFELTPFATHDLRAWGEAGLELAKTGQTLVSDDEVRDWCDRKLRNRFTKVYKELPSEKAETVIFLSSSHEYLSLQPYISKRVDLGTELDFVRQVIEDKGEAGRYAVRCHPNQAQDRSHAARLAPLKQFCEDNGVAFYGPESQVSSYELIEASDNVAVDISSIGIDALLMGKQLTMYGWPAYRAAYEYFYARTYRGPDLAKCVVATMLSSWRAYTRSETARSKMIRSVLRL